MQPAIQSIGPTQGQQPALDQPRADRRVQGAPWRKTWLQHEAGPMSAGVWECEVGRWRIQFAPNKQEYFFVLSGRVRLHGPEGSFTDIGPGQAAVIPPGFEGEFEVPGGCRALGMPRAGLPGPARLDAAEACGGPPQRGGNDAWQALAAQPGGFERERGQCVVGRACQTPGMAAPGRLALAPFPLERGACPKPDSLLPVRKHFVLVEV